MNNADEKLSNYKDCQKAVKSLYIQQIMQPINIKVFNGLTISKDYLANVRKVFNLLKFLKKINLFLAAVVNFI